MKYDPFLVNSNISFKDTKPIDKFIEPHIFDNALIRKRGELIDSSVIIEIDARYDFRPDRLAYEYYNQDFWYPALLVANNIGSMLQFKAEFLNHKCRIPNIEVLRKILNEELPEYYTTSEMIETIFAT